jgi:hypothetical protein
MKICSYNKKFFEVNEPVSIFVELKNIQTVKLKIFEIVAENYFLAHKKTLDEHVDLDGLTAQEETNFDLHSYYEGPCQIITREFSL